MRPVIAYIPARGGSKRVPRKNIQPLGGKPVIGHTIEKLRELDFVADIFVSTDDAEIKRTAEDFGARCLEFRAAELSDDKAGFIDLIHKDIPRHCAAAGGIKEILFVLATAALVPPEIYRQAYIRYLETKPDVVMSCERFHSSPYWAMEQAPDGFWRPIFPEMVLINSQNLPKALIDAGLFYFFNIDTMMRYQSLKIVDRLMAYEMPVDFAVDVDSPEDWRRLEDRFTRLQAAGGQP